MWQKYIFLLSNLVATNKNSQLWEAEIWSLYWVNIKAAATNWANTKAAATIWAIKLGGSSGRPISPVVPQSHGRAGKYIDIFYIMSHDSCDLMISFREGCREKKTRKTVWSFNITILNCNICLPFKCGATCVPGKVAIGGDQSLVQLELCSSFTLPVFKSFKHPHSTSKCHSVQVHHQDNVYNDSWQTLVFLCELS